MTTRQKVRTALFAAIALLLAFVMADTLGLRESGTGVISPKGYIPISHGGHSHYVPNDWNGEPAISNFPSTPPPEGMTVGPDGQIVPLAE